jgi:UDP-N-acetylmuramate--alanine ligase
MNVINNIDLDHIDCYENIDEVKDAFLSFANSLPFYGTAFICIDDQNIIDIKNKIKRPYKTFGLNKNAQIKASKINYSGFKSKFSLYIEDSFQEEIILSVPGKHNIQNSLAAISVALDLNIETNIIKKGLKKYNGVKRRLEVKHSFDNGTLLIDDYAHHPSEVKASLLAIKKASNNRIITIFQPHLFSRTLNFYHEFSDALSLSDILILMDIYPSREKPINNVSSILIYDDMIRKGYKNIFLNSDSCLIPNMVNKVYNEGDIIITMGAGDIYKQNDIIFEVLNVS